jgi:F-type H+-transporting ATPase subunit gamma
MAKARAIMKRRKAVRNIRKITRTMQMIATAKFQKSLKRTVGTKPYTMKIRELVREVASCVGDVDHPLLRKPEPGSKANREAVIVITSNRGLCGGYNGSVLRLASQLLDDLKKRSVEIDLSVIGRKGITYFKFRKVPIRSSGSVRDVPAFAEVKPKVQELMDRFIRGEIDAAHVVFMDFISTGVQKPRVLTLLPLSGAEALADSIVEELAEKEAQVKAGVMDSKRRGDDVKIEEHVRGEVQYDFSPSAKELFDELLPLTVQTAFFQAFLDATASEHVARMVAMKSATDNADKIGKALALQYNRARQSQITTELSEIMGGVEAMNG